MPQLKLNLLQKKNNIPQEIIAAAGRDLIAARILYGRGYDTVRKIRDFFLADYTPVQTEDIPDVDKAVQRIRLAVEKREQICVYGDYDVDGVTSTVILMECLRELKADAIYHVPDRFSEGYGMNKEVIQSLKSQDVKLVVTCDCGISNVEEIGLANQLGMDVIVTDHHTPPEMCPDAYCIINPKLWGISHKAHDVSGAVVAFYLARALLESYGRMEKAEQFLDLLALSIVADVVPLTSENRCLFKKGLEQITGTQRAGLKGLIDIGNKAGVIINEDFLGFQIAPRINAAGRLDTARKAVELLMTEDKYEAEQLSLELNTLNISRKEIEAGIVRKAEEVILSNLLNKSILIAYDENWHHGVIGIAAGRISEKYNKTAILLTLKEDGKTVVGSARAPEGISIYDILKKCDQYLIKYGGHSAAAGLSLKVSDIDRFIKQAEKEASQYKIDDIKLINIDLELDLKNIDEELLNSIKKLSPFGEGFPQPVFLTRAVNIVSNLPIRDIGRRMTIGDGTSSISAVYWSDAGFDAVCDKIDIVHSLQESTFRGSREIKLSIRHIMQPDVSENRPLPQMKIIDLRQTQEYIYQPGDVIFYEGIGKPLEVKTFNRYEIIGSKRVVLYSIPPDLKVLKEILTRSMPKELVLIFKDESEQGSFLIDKAMGIIKHIVNRKHGRTSYAELASILGITLEMTDLLLKTLHFSGIISFEEFYDELIITRGTGKSLPDAEKYKKALISLINEMNSFRKYIRSAGIEKIKSTL